MPLFAAGTLILNHVSVSVAPSARLPCSYSGGTAFRAVTDTETMLGRIMMASTTMALNRHAPDALPKALATAGTSTCIPSRPNTTLGMPLSSSMAVTTTVRTRGPAAFERKTAVNSPTGTPMRVAPSVPYTLERMKGRMPYFGSAAVEAHSVPNRKRNRPILRMAGTPDAIMYTEMRITQPTANIPHRKNRKFITASSHSAGVRGSSIFFRNDLFCFIDSGHHAFTGTAPAVRMRSAASVLVAKSKKACACSDRVTDLLVTKTKGRWTS